MLALDGVVHTYGKGPSEVRALQGVDLAVGRGEVILVVGPSGGGKTTALLAMGLLLRPTAGVVRLAGQSMNTAPNAQRTQARLLRLGFVFQQFNLLKALSVAENVALPLRYAGVRKGPARARAAALLDGLGMAHRLAHRPQELSGGEKQRVAVARALAMGPEVVLADEPTGNLDSVAGQRVIEQLTATARRNAAAVVIVTHDTRLAPVADRLLRLEDGRLVELHPAASRTDTTADVWAGAQDR